MMPITQKILLRKTFCVYIFLKESVLNFDFKNINLIFANR